MSVRSPLALVAAVLVSAIVPLATPAAADTGPVPLGMTGFARIVADEVRGHLFLSPGRSGSGVAVTDLAGAHVATLDGLPAATGMALTPDGGSLWVALPGLGALKRVDTATLTITGTIAVPTGQCPGDVAVVGDRLVYGHSCNQYSPNGGDYGGIGVVDAGTGAYLGGTTSGPFYRPVVAAGPAGQVYAADTGLSPTDLHLYDVTGAAPVLLAERDQACSNLRDLSAAPDGSRVVTACGSPYSHSTWSSHKLESGTSYATGAYPVAGAWSADGQFVAGTDSAYSTDVSVHAAGTSTPTWTADFGSSDAILLPRGLAASADGSRVWAVTGGSSGPALRVLHSPSPASTAMTLAADPPAFPVGSSTEVGGWLSWGGVGIAGVELGVTRAATGAAPVALPAVTTRSDGTFVFPDTPAEVGSYTYTVSWAGDSTRDGTSASTTVEVEAPATALSLRLSQSPNTPGQVDGAVLLEYSGSDSPAGRPVQLTREVGGTTTALPSVTTDAYGGAKFSDTPPSGTVTYSASVEAYGSSPAATTSASTTVLTATTLTATSPSRSDAGAPVTLHGVLSAGTQAVSGASLAVVRSGCTATGWRTTATTASDGTWTVTDPEPPVGTCTYAVSYTGGDGYAASSASTSTTVALHTTSLTADAPSTSVAGSAVAVGGALTSGVDGVGGAPVSVTRTGCSSTGWSDKTVTADDGSWSVVDPAAPGGACTYAASYVGSSTHASSGATAATQVAFRTTDLTLSVVRGTGSTKKYAYVTGQLGAWHDGKTLTITAQPTGGAEVVLASGTVDSAGKLTARYQPKTTTTYRVTYAGDDWYSAAKAERTQ